MPRWREVADEFAFVDGPMKLELLLDYARQLPELPDRHKAERDAGLGRVHECQSPVFLFPEVEGEAATLHAYAPSEAPTARGFVSLLKEVVDGQPPDDVAAIPDDFLQQLGIGQQLGMMRLQGLTAVLYRVKAGIAQAASAS